MTHRQFDDKDRAALRKLDDSFEIDASNETASVAGAMKIEIIRAADDRLRLTIEFPAGEEFIIFLSRAQTLKQLGVGENDS